MKAAFFLAILGLFLTAVFVETTEIEETDREYYKPACPCKCFTGYDIHKAQRMCRRRPFRYYCKVQRCTKGYYYDGKTCCDAPKPKPTPSRTPTPSPKPRCPCKCVAKRWARNECKYLPYCEVTKCEDEHIPHHPPHYEYKYTSYKPTFQCCYKPHYPPHHY